MDLSPGDNALGLEAESRRQTAAILCDRAGLITGEGTEVEAVKRYFADAAKAGGECCPSTGEVGLQPANPCLLTPSHPPNKAESQRVDGESFSAGRGQGRGQLLLAPGELSVELATQRIAQSPSQRRTLGNPGSDQVGAVDLKANSLPLGEEPV